MQDVFSKFRDGVSKVNVPFSGGKSVSNLLGIDNDKSLEDEEKFQEHSASEQVNNQAYL
jgi:hypothetical protein